MSADFSASTYAEASVTAVTVEGNTLGSQSDPFSVVVDGVIATGNVTVGQLVRGGGDGGRRRLEEGVADTTVRINNVVSVGGYVVLHDLDVGAVMSVSVSDVYVKGVALGQLVGVRSSLARHNACRSVAATVESGGRRQTQSNVRRHPRLWCSFSLGSLAFLFAVVNQQPTLAYSCRRSRRGGRACQ